MSFFKAKHSFGHISGMVGLIHMKRKSWALVGYWVNDMTLTFDLTDNFDLEILKVKFWNSSISGIVIKSPQYTGGDFMFLYRFVRHSHRRRRRRQILVHAITFEQLFKFLSFLVLLALTYRLPV